MKKRRVLYTMLSILLILGALIFGFIYYIAPSKQLTMDFSPIKLEDKLLQMANNLNTELILNESDINALVKSHLPTELNEQLAIKGAHFKVEHDTLYADLHVTVANLLHAEVKASYAISWEDPVLTLTPVSLSLKDIKLPAAWLEKIELQLYNKQETYITIDRIYTNGNELVIKLKLQLF